MLAAAGVHFPGRPPTLVVSMWVSAYRLYLLLIFSRTKIRNGIEKGEADQLPWSPPWREACRGRGQWGWPAGAGGQSPQDACRSECSSESPPMGAGWTP